MKAKTQKKMSVMKKIQDQMGEIQYPANMWQALKVFVEIRSCVYHKIELN
jgi:hypothetical protein